MMGMMKFSSRRIKNETMKDFWLCTDGWLGIFDQPHKPPKLKGKKTFSGCEERLECRE